MTKIRALRQFSHYHAGNFDQFEVREVKDEWAEALVGMELAEVVEGELVTPITPNTTASKSKKKEG